MHIAVSLHLTMIMYSIEQHSMSALLNLRTQAAHTVAECFVYAACPHLCKQLQCGCTAHLLAGAQSGDLCMKFFCHDDYVVVLYDGMLQLHTCNRQADGLVIASNGTVATRTAARLILMLHRDNTRKLRG